MRITFAGSGDAFGSGGKLNTCFFVESENTNFLIDCGASAMISLRKFHIDPNAVSTIVISHLHGDHFGGLGFFIIDAQLISKRKTDLTIIGPPGLEARHRVTMEALFPGSVDIRRQFEIHFIEIPAEQETSLEHLKITPFVVEHSCGAPPYALRVVCEGKVLSYTGDTQWTPAIISAGAQADLLIAECYHPSRQLKGHLDYLTLKQHLDEIAPKRIILTHMSADMLDTLDDIDIETAYDGLVVTI